MSGWGSTSSMIGLAVLVSAARRISKPRGWARCIGCKSSPGGSAASSRIRTCATSPPDQSTYLLSPWYRKSFFKPALRVAGLAAVRPAAHLRVAADRPRRQREGCAGAARARDASIPLDTYGHLFPSELEALADRLERARATALADHRERTLRGPAVGGLHERAGGCRRAGGVRSS